MKKRIVVVCTVLMALMAVAVAIPVVVINVSSKGRVYSDVSKVPFNHVGVLLGCSQKLSNGCDNLFFKYRIRAAAELYAQNKINYLIVSGDNSRRGYDEPTDMKNALVECGIPAERIFCDYAGFRTLDSIVRANTIFGCTNVTVISQEFHNKRAIFIARHRNIDAVGYNAREVTVFHSFKTKAREFLAKTLTVLDIYVLNRQPRFAGPGIEIPSGV